LLAVPVTMAIRLLLQEFDQARWLVVLIARAPAAAAGPAAPARAEVVDSTRARPGRA
jgi:hypothetical protein